MTDINKGKKLDFTIGDVVEVYSGPVGILWEMLMGEEIHVGGEAETDRLADKAGIGKDTHVLDVCSALGGPARHLVKRFGCRVTGLDATPHMVEEAIKRTGKAGLSDRITFKLGNALDMPFKSESFDVVWGQDAWCYVTDKKRLISEAARMVKSGGVLAFTDWIQAGNMSEEEWTALNGFMAFPDLETMDGYATLIKEAGLELVEKEDLTTDFARHCHGYQDKLRNQLRQGILDHYGPELFKAADDGLDMWVRAADEAKMGRGRWVARKA